MPEIKGTNKLNDNRLAVYVVHRELYYLVIDKKLPIEIISKIFDYLPCPFHLNVYKSIEVLNQRKYKTLSTLTNYDLTCKNNNRSWLSILAMSGPTDSYAITEYNPDKYAIVPYHGC